MYLLLLSLLFFCTNSKKFEFAFNYNDVFHQLEVDISIQINPSRNRGCDYMISGTNTNCSLVQVELDELIMESSSFSLTGSSRTYIPVVLLSNDSFLNIFEFDCNRFKPSFMSCSVDSDLRNCKTASNEFERVCLCADTDRVGKCSLNSTFNDCSPEWWISNNSHTLSTRYPPFKTSSIPFSTINPGLSSTISPQFPSLRNLSESVIGLNNVSLILNETLTYSEGKEQLKSDEIQQIAEIIWKSSRLKGIRSNDSLLILRNFDNVLFAEQDRIQSNSSTSYLLLSTLNQIAQNTVDPTINYLHGSNIGFSASRLNCANISSLKGLEDTGNSFRAIDQLPNSDNSIMVPTGNICAKESISHAHFSIFRNRKLFDVSHQYHNYGKSPRRRDSRIIKRIHKRSSEDSYGCDDELFIVDNEPVMSATVMNEGGMVSMTKDQSVMARLQYNIQQVPKPLHGKFHVVYWDEGRKQWSNDRPCRVIQETSDKINVECSHLTDFTLIVAGRLDDPVLCDETLGIIGYVVNVISIISLVFLTVVSAMAFVKSVKAAKLMFYLRGQVLYKGDLIVLAYYSSLLLFYVFFTFFSDSQLVGNGAGCVTMASIMYALLLSTIILNLLQGFKTISFIFKSQCRAMLEFVTSPLVAMFLAYGVPIIISLCFALITPSLFERNDSFCWIRPDRIIQAVILPITIIVLNAILCTSLVTIRVFHVGRAQLKVIYYDADLWSKITGIILMQISLGAPWVLQYFTISSSSATFWHYVFTIVLGSNGFILLLIFIYRRQKLIIESRQSSEKSRKASKR